MNAPAMAAVRSALQKKLDAAMNCHRQGDVKGAEKLYRQVLATDPRHVVAMHLLGAVLLQQDRDRQAADVIRKGLALAPDNVILLANMGEAQRRLGEYDKALDSLNQATRLQPDIPEAHYTRGLVFQAQKRFGEAAVSYQRAIALRPDFRAAHERAGEVFEALERFDETLEAWRRVVEFDPSNARAHDGIGIALRQQGRADEAVASFRRAIESCPEDSLAHSHLVYTLGFLPSQDGPGIAAEAVRWRTQHTGAMHPRRRPHPNDRDPHRRLRVGYVSPDFRQHSHVLFLTPLIEHHNRQNVEVFGYSSVARPDAYTERIERAVDHFRDVSAATDEDLAETIRSDGIDVLVDVALYCAGSRLRAFAAKPAPVQVTWLAYPGTTGLDTVDYRITDIYLDPPDADIDGCYTERSHRLPETFWCYDPLTQQPEVGPLPALRSGRIMFGCFNSFSKTNGQVFALWSAVLRAVADARMTVLARPGVPRSRARDAFASEGVDPERIDFVDYRPRDEYFGLYHDVDIGLDTVPVNGGTTSLDSFWMGVPVISPLGHTVLGRAGLCFASNLGLPELSARTPEQFVQAAVDLSRDKERLAHLRATLRTRLEQSPLMDAERFARHLEEAFRSMWQRWCSETPASPAG
jgi:predicted O-linked N-acetylglucosamine transferase (SPINDLY family)